MTFGPMNLFTLLLAAFPIYGIYGRKLALRVGNMLIVTPGTLIVLGSILQYGRQGTGTFITRWANADMVSTDA
jgi:hypothetical protein